MYSTASTERSLIRWLLYLLLFHQFQEPYRPWIVSTLHGITGQQFLCDYNEKRPFSNPSGCQPHTLSSACVTVVPPLMNSDCHLLRFDATNGTSTPSGRARHRARSKKPLNDLAHVTDKWLAHWRTECLIFSRSNHGRRSPPAKAKDILHCCANCWTTAMRMYKNAGHVTGQIFRCGTAST